MAKDLNGRLVRQILAIVIGGTVLTMMGNTAVTWRKMAVVEARLLTVIDDVAEIKQTLAER